VKFASLGLAAAAALAIGVAAGPLPGEPSPATHGARPTHSPSPHPSPSPQSTLTPDDIFHKAIAATRNNPDPPYITYMMHEIFVHHGRTFTYDYRVWYRTDGKGLMQSASPTRNGQAETRFGYPFPSAPDNNILLYATPPPPSSPPPGPIGTPAPGTAPPLLGVQPIVADRYYDVSLLGLEDYEGHPVYHLGLRAVRDEDQHPWKDLWIDVRSFEVWKAHASASGRRGPMTGSIDFSVVFAPVGPYWMVASAVGDGEGHFGFIGDSGHYEYAFSDFGFPATLPDWFFDPKAFYHHFR